MKTSLLLSILVFGSAACNLFEVRSPAGVAARMDTLHTDSSLASPVFSETRNDSFAARAEVPSDNTRQRDTLLPPPKKGINTGSVQPEEVVAFAQTLIGTPYKYASVDPERGFDCSGFITYVFNHFRIAVPRSSIDFTNVGQTVAVADAKAVDLILFTGTDSTERHIGHMGLVLSSDNDTLQFIHASSGKAMGVTVTPLNGYYKSRFVRVARIFTQNDLPKL